MPILDIEYNRSISYGSYVQGDVGLELYLSDRLAQHALLLRGFVGSRSNIVFDYSNGMLPVTLRARAGFSQSRDLYPSARLPQRYEQVTDTRWGFLYGGASLQLSLFHSVT